MRKSIFLAAILSLSLAPAAFAADSAVTVTTGAGYVPVVKNAVAVCRSSAGIEINESYGGNVGQMLAQAAAGSGVNVLITDKTTLEGMKTPVKFSTIQSIGRTPLVLIWRQGVALSSADDISGKAVKSVAIPDSKAAVYGRAGSEWVKGKGEAFSAAVTPKLMQVQGVPQVASYVVRGEVDAGFVNVQAARKNADKLGGSIEIPDGYQPIEMVAAVVAGEEKSANVQKFLTCLKGEQAKKIFAKAGVR